ncbi:hypothetical protein [Maridesulfovibrio sp.]|uniref:hypothetical protein n=1 Tax=Maridesulfovibrio sp. TaxID=2795000 RepID=UPI0029CA2F00|nr:hypothetical protein [Maridesulfovibrio sp.]
MKRPQVNFKGDIRLTKRMLDFPDSTYAHGDQFELEIDNEGIVLTRVVDKSETAATEPEKVLDAADEKAKAKTDHVIEYNGRSIKSWSNGFRNSCRRAGISDDFVSYDIRHLFCCSMRSQRATPRTTPMLPHSLSTY